MTDKNLLEDDIIDLTDLLEEGSPPLKTEVEIPRRKAKHEPDSFDLGKEISMDFDVSIEEIEHENPALTEEKPLDLVSEAREHPEAREATKESLGDIGAEIDLAMQDRFEEVTITKNEEAVLLQEGPEEEPAAVPEEEPPVTAQERAEVPAGEPVPQQTPACAAVPTEVIVDAVVSEFRKDMPAMMEGIVRPVVQELLQEITASTREALPGIVEKVIREEIERLKKL